MPVPLKNDARATLAKTPIREHDLLVNVARRLLHYFQDITLHIKMTIVKKTNFTKVSYTITIWNLSDLFLRLLIILTLEYFSKQVKIAWNWSLIPRIKKDLNWDIFVFKVTIIRRSTTSPIFIKLVSPNNNYKHKYVFSLNEYPYNTAYCMYADVTHMDTTGRLLKRIFVPFTSFGRTLHAPGRE